MGKWMGGKNRMSKKGEMAAYKTKQKQKNMTLAAGGEKKMKETGKQTKGEKM